jgi:cytochrome P450 family 135
MTTTDVASTQVEQAGPERAASEQASPERAASEQGAPARAAPEQPVLDGAPPGPRMPRALQTVLWAARPLSFMRRARRRHGDLFTIRPYAFGDIVVLANPEHIKEVFTGDRDVFAAGRANAAMSPVLGTHSLLTLDGERHLCQRKLMLPPFHGEAVGRYRKRIEEITSAEVASWPTGKPFPISPRMQSITFEIILRAVIGVSDPRRLARLRELLPKLLDFSVLEMWAVWLCPKLIDNPLARRVPSQRVRPEVDRLLYEEIAAHRAHPERHDDILALLVAARDADGEPLSDENLLDQIITLLLAGHETTTTGLSWAFERLTRHPDALGRLQRELETGAEEYLEAVVNETLRVRPVIDGVWRKLTAPVVVAGRRLPAGTLVFPAIALVQTSEDAFPHPEEFRPERFLEGSPLPYTFIPFGGGPRRCIGAAFAVMEMKTVLSTVLQRVELSAPDQRPEQPRPHHVTLIPARGGRVVATMREVPAAPPAPRDASLRRGGTARASAVPTPPSSAAGAA